MYPFKAEPPRILHTVLQHTHHDNMSNTIGRSNALFLLNYASTEFRDFRDFEKKLRNLIIYNIN